MKIFGADLETLEAKAEAVQQGDLPACPASPDITLVRELGQPSLTIEPDRAKIARYGLNVADINTLIETAVGGSAGDAGDPGRAVVRPRRPAAGAVPAEHGRDQEPADRDARRPAPAAQPVRRHQGRARARRSSTARATRASSASSSASKGATWRARSQEAQQKVAGGGAAADRLHLRLGRRVQGVPRGAVADDGHRAADGRADPADPVRALRQPEVPADHHVQRAGDGAGRRPARAEADRHALQRVVRASASSR